jgi:hypothetical protein
VGAHPVAPVEFCKTYKEFRGRRTRRQALGIEGRREYVVTWSQSNARLVMYVQFQHCYKLYSVASKIRAQRLVVVIQARNHTCTASLAAASNFPNRHRFPGGGEYVLLAVRCTASLLGFLHCPYPRSMNYELSRGDYRGNLAFSRSSARKSSQTLHERGAERQRDGRRAGISASRQPRPSSKRTRRMMSRLRLEVSAALWIWFCGDGLDGRDHGMDGLEDGNSGAFTIKLRPIARLQAGEQMIPHCTLRLGAHIFITRGSRLTSPEIKVTT